MIDEQEEQSSSYPKPASLTNSFTFLQEGIEPIQTSVTLFENYLTIIPEGMSGDKCKMQFDFDTVYSILRENTTEEQIKTHCGPAIGIKIEKFEESIQLINKCSEIVEKWNHELAKKLNQRNFHQLFKPLKKIGKGNFATVYLATKHSNKELYAVKAFSKEREYDQERGKQSLENQINMMRRFQHKNLMKLQGVYETQNSLYICFEYYGGGVLYDKIKERYKFSPEEIKTVMKSLLSGISELHSKNIMHRDLKPENILMRDEFDYDCVIGDFGLATDYTLDEYIFKRCGTPGYVAPEISNLKNINARYDPVCDVFSLGVIFHILTLNKSPFPGREADQVLKQNRECELNFDSHEYERVPAQWLDLLKRMLEKDPEKRIRAREALQHKFFDETTNIPEELTGSVKSYDQCESPLMMSKNPKRKRNLRLRDDSCLKFKMKENLLNQGEGEQVDRINSPVSLSKKIHRQRNEKKCKTFQPSNFRSG